jgi:hypothetical protein
MARLSKKAARSKTSRLRRKWRQWWQEARQELMPVWQGAGRDSWNEEPEWDSKPVEKPAGKLAVVRQLGDRQVGNLLYFELYPPLHRCKKWNGTPGTGADVKTGYGDYKLPFGKYKGKTLYEVLDLNPGYLEWFSELEYLYDSTRKTICRFLEQPGTQAVYRELEVPRWERGPAFIPSMQTTRKFSHGKKTWLKVEGKPDRSDPGYQWRWAGPQEPERDWTPPEKKPPRYSDPLPKQPIEQPEEPPQITSRAAAWEVAAELLIALDERNAGGWRLKDSSFRSLLKQLKDWLKPEVLHQLRERWLDTFAMDKGG